MRTRYVYKESFACDTGELYNINLSSNYDAILSAQEIFSKINTLRALYVFGTNAKGSISCWGTRIAYIPGRKGYVSINEIITKLFEITKKQYLTLSFDERFCGRFMDMKLNKLYKQSFEQTEEFIKKANFISAFLLKLKDFIFEFKVFTGLSDYAYREFYVERRVFSLLFMVGFPFKQREGDTPGEMERRVTISVKKDNGETFVVKLYDFHEWENVTTQLF